jgi:hypothetical protein
MADIRSIKLRIILNKMTFDPGRHSKRLRNTKPERHLCNNVLGFPVVCVIVVVMVMMGMLTMKMYHCLC